MKARPIIMNGDMVRALLDGRKVQTRRVIKEPCNGVTTDIEDGEAWITNQNDEWVPRVSPFGQPGDLLWVRETCRAHEDEPGLDCVRYAADHGFRPIEDTPEAADLFVQLASYGMKKSGQVECRTVPSIHMPRWASRLTLKIINVRVERLREISEADSEAEGISPYDVSMLDEEEIQLLDAPLTDSETPFKNGFALLWSSIYGSESWEANPWVWVIDFETIQRNVDDVIGGDA